MAAPAIESLGGCQSTKPSTDDDDPLLSHGVSASCEIVPIGVGMIVKTPCFVVADLSHYALHDRCFETRLSFLSRSGIRTNVYSRRPNPCTDVAISAEVPRSFTPTLSACTFPSVDRVRSSSIQQSSEL